jgi:hypothetical protein
MGAGLHGSVTSFLSCFFFFLSFFAAFLTFFAFFLSFLCFLDFLFDELEELLSESVDEEESAGWPSSIASS